MYKDSFVLFERTQISETLRMENLCDAEGFYWFTSYYFNALFKMDKRNWKAQYVCSFSEAIFKKRMYSKIIRYGSKLYCVPLSADSIGVYDMFSNECKNIQIQNPEEKGKVIYREDSKFIDATCDKEYLYLLPHTYPAVVRMRFSDGHIDYFDKFLSELDFSDKNAKELPTYYFGRFTQSNENRWIFSYASGKICYFSLPDMRFEQYGCFQIKGQAVLVCDAHFIWLFSILESVIYKINLKTGNYIKIFEFPREFVPGSTSLTRGILYGNYVFFLPGTANHSIKVDINTDEVSFAEEFCPGVTKTFLEKEVWKFSLLENLDGKLFAFDDSDNQLIEYDIRNREIRKQEVIIDFFDKKTKKWMDEYFWFGENNSHRVRNLDSFLDLLVQESIQTCIEMSPQRKNDDKSSNMSIGQEIYREVVKK